MRAGPGSMTRLAKARKSKNPNLDVVLKLFEYQEKIRARCCRGRWAISYPDAPQGAPIRGEGDAPMTCRRPSPSARSLLRPFVIRNQTMCFSATASFTATAVLVPTGMISVYRAAKADQRYVAIGALPLLFGIQQLFEGVVWIAGERAAPGLVNQASLAYMFFSWLAWPVWVPMSTYFLEADRRRPLFLVLSILGGMLGATQYVPYFLHRGWLTTAFLPNAISYNATELLDFVIGRHATYALYLLAIIAPLFLSSNRDARIFGVLVTAVLIVTYLFFQYAYISVFCAGGAIMSLYLVAAIGRQRRRVGHDDI